MSEDRFTSSRPKKTQTPPPRRSVLINLTIQVLRGLVDQLEGIITQLEKTPHPNNRNRSQPNRSRILLPLRRFFPPMLNRILPDSILAIAIGTTVLILFTQILHPFAPPQPPAELSETPLPEPTPTEIITENPSEEILTEPPPTLPEVEPFPVEIVTEPPETSEDIQLPLETETLTKNPNQIPLILVATAPPEPIQLISPPNLDITPEQYLIHQIQTQLSTSIAKINPEIIASVQASFSGSLLRVELTDTWYNLAEDQQNQLAQVIFQQAQNFDFTRLELISTTGKPIARNAVIGQNMVILNRTNLDSDPRNS